MPDMTATRAEPMHVETDVLIIGSGGAGMFGEGNTRVWDLLRGWLDDYFPAAAAARKVAARAGH